MAYSPVPTVVTGDLWTAANHNTYIRDNFAAGVPDIFTTKGDLAVASANDAASRLAVGTVGKILTPDTAHAVGMNWKELYYSTAIARAYKAAGMTIGTAGAGTLIGWDTALYDPLSALTLGASFKYTAQIAGYYLVSCHIEFTGASGWDAGETATLMLYKNDTLFCYLDRWLSQFGGTYAPRLGGMALVQLAVSDYIDTRASQTRTTTSTMSGGSTFSYIDIVRVG